MKCPQCSSGDSKVIESRDVSESSSIRRRRQCLGCSSRFTTYERVERPHLVVIKRSGERTLYDRSKLLAGIMRASEKRPVSQVEIEGLIAEIERELHGCDESEIASQKIGDMVLKRLALLDPVAYVRFASVYRDFDTLDSFEKELTRVRKQLNASSTA